MNKELKNFLYMLVGYEFTRENYEKTLMYFNQIVQQKEHYKKKTLDNLFMKDFNGEKIFCLENDKETFKDMIFMLQERIDKAIEHIEHELNGHILLNDEVTWNEEYYTKGKLDYRKLLIALLQQTLDILKGKEDEEN